MKKGIFVAACMVIISATACKKENDPPPFSPVGYWKGNLYLYNIAVLNRPDGTTRLYMGVSGQDTSLTIIGKYESEYTMDRNIFKSRFATDVDTFYFEGNNISQAFISGVARGAQGTAVPFELHKQP